MVTTVAPLGFALWKANRSFVESFRGGRICPNGEQRRKLLLNRSVDVAEGGYLSNAQRGTGPCLASPALRPRLAPAATYQVRGTAGSLRGRVCLAEMACQVSFRARGVGATDSPRRVAEIVGWRGISAHRQTATPSPPASARSLRARVCLAEMGARGPDGLSTDCLRRNG